jgi:hypothetical protein
MLKTPKNQAFSRFLEKEMGIDHLELGYTRYPSKNLVLLFLLLGNA